MQYPSTCSPGHNSISVETFFSHAVNVELKAAGEIRIPFGLGIAGYVAQTKKVINLADAYTVSYQQDAIWAINDRGEKLFLKRMRTGCFIFNFFLRSSHPDRIPVISSI